MADNTVFRFEVLCTSKQLGGALAALTGLVAQVSPPQMVANAEHTGNGVVQMSAADLIELFLGWLKKKKLTEFKPNDAREFLREHGRSNNSYSYLLTKMKEHGMVKNLGDSPSTSRWVLTARGASSRKGSKKSKPVARKLPVRPRRTATAAQAAKAE